MVLAGRKEEEEPKKNIPVSNVLQFKKETGDVSMVDSTFCRC